MERERYQHVMYCIVKEKGTNVKDTDLALVVMVHKGGPRPKVGLLVSAQSSGAKNHGIYYDRTSISEMAAPRAFRLLDAHMRRNILPLIEHPRPTAPGCHKTVPRRKETLRQLLLQKRLQPKPSKAVPIRMYNK